VIDVSICVATFRRPHGLLRLLRSLARLDPSSPRHEIIVADNDDAGSAAAPVRQARAEGIAVEYVLAPVRGIAQARNCSVAPARGTYVAFIDDDEEADPRWLLEMVGEVERHGADGGIGPVLPCFHDAAPRWMIDGGFFERDRWPTGTVLDRRGFRTGNALIRREMLAALRGPFDERFALSGGEDTDLFTRLIAGGCRIVSVDSAVVWEHLPPNRTTVSWYLRRRFLIGMGSARVYSSETHEVRSGEQRLRWLASGLAWGMTGLLVFPASRTSGLTRLAHGARHLGHFAFYSGYSYNPYAQDSWR
jgi:succinoglycan biosynthesis protein ExoM